jgi:hypothetical protein
MDEEIKRIARDAAKALEASGHGGVRLQVEETIAREGAGQLTDPIALGALIVATASFAWRTAWDLYLEHRKRGDGAFPRLAGQLHDYIFRKLVNWNKERGQDRSKPDTSAIMEPIAHSLKEPQIEAVAAYVSYLE